ncbi:NUDIX hydrolase [Kitasatospora sp. NPDC004615]|uniref:NUDIX hydrolase n=1 Tax=Kitasatospora sp. NPDC004615 TaxID=3364017 RepID=UPI0036B57F51
MRCPITRRAPDDTPDAALPSRPAPAAFAAILPHHAVSASVLVTDEDRRILMLHQARPYPGHPAWWQPPAGLADPGETPLATALRELAEETGIQPATPLRPLAVDYRFAAGGWPPVIDFAFAADPVPAGTPVYLSREHDAFAWRPTRSGCRSRSPIRPDVSRTLHRGRFPDGQSDGCPTGPPTAEALEVEAADGAAPCRPNAPPRRPPTCRSVNSSSGGSGSRITAACTRAYGPRPPRRGARTRVRPGIRAFSERAR